VITYGHKAHDPRIDARRRQSRIRKEPVMNNHITYVGMDAHKKSIQVALLLPEENVPTQWEIPNEPRVIKRMAKKLLKEAPGEVRCCYEAGPCGYALQRELKKHHVDCIVIAPTLTPRKPGDRIKTDRKDAKALATFYRAGLLTEVHPPTEKDEAVRDLCRCREDAKEDLNRHRHQMTKFLLRRAYIYPGKTHWTHLHRRWLLGLRFEDPVDEKIFNDYLLAIEQADERLLTLDTYLSELAEEEPYRDPVAWLRCFRGIDTVTAMTTVAELHDFRRFHAPRQLMA
jgi:transposase